ncbi:hypothetical protein V3C99_014852 [Haemonchus contortus]|uniref:Uncharacterized protein n=1 Tax=Haemonchus contortus TaxID=6289 RepID=A0A7I4YWK9_HAECO
MQHLLRRKESPNDNLHQWRQRSRSRPRTRKKVIPQNCKEMKVLLDEDLAPQHRPLQVGIAMDLPKKSKTRTERRIRWWKLNRAEREHLKEKVVEAGLSHPERRIQQT